MAISKEDILEAVGGMTVMELNDLVKAFREELLARLLGVMQAPVAGFAVVLGALARQREEAVA